MSERYYSTGQVARMCRMTKHTILAAIERGELPASTTPGGHNRIRESDAISFMKGHNLPTDTIERRGKKILVVDDEEDMLTLIRDIFEGEGYHIESASCGYDAGVLAERLHPDLILLDIMLPDIDGREICRQIKRNQVTKHAKVLAVTALKSAADRKDLFAAGVDDYIAKPFEVDDLRKKVVKLLKEASSQLRAVPGLL